MRLYIKIFLWFWLTVIVTSGTLVVLTELTHSKAEEDREWEIRAASIVDMWANQKMVLLRKGGVAAVEAHAATIQPDPVRRTYLLDADGNDVQGRRQVTAPIAAIAAALANSASGTQRLDAARRIGAQRVSDTTGRLYTVVVPISEPPTWRHSLLELLVQDSRASGVSRGAITRLAVVLAVAGVLCLLLSRHFAAPIERLRAATREIGKERLGTRVDRVVLNRRDELGDLALDFDRMTGQLERLLTAQRNLLSDVSHALRSPIARLNVALGLARRVADPVAGAHFDRMEYEADRLNTLIGQLLTMARVDSGVDLERKQVLDLERLVESAVADADYEGRSRNRTVRLVHGDECSVEGVCEMLRMAIENVVHNAVRHTDEGTVVEVALTRHATDQALATASIRVSDRGPGVPERAMADLFTPFHRVPSAPASGGAGLGLAITKRVFEVHQGTAVAENRPGGGLTVTLRIPIYGGDVQSGEAIVGEAAAIPAAAS